MNSFLLSALVFLIADVPARQPHPLAPSIPQLTKEEEQRIERVIDRFIQFDIGKLGGGEGKKALEDFNRLGPEAIFCLIEGLNRAANMESSCPAVLIGKKIAMILGASNDVELLSFAKENIGAGVTARRHLGVVKDLQLGAQLRRAAVQRRIATAGNAGKTKAVASMTLTELAALVGSERGPQLKMALMEIEKRDGPVVLNTLGVAASSYEKEIKELSQTLLIKHLTRQKPDVVKAHLTHERAEVRAAAVQVTGSRGLRFGQQLINLLDDADAEVRQSARRALTQLSRGLDYGPERGASSGERSEALRRWQAWWDRTAK
jgi:hypothetical protein